MRIGALAWLGMALAATLAAQAAREPARAEGAIAVGTTGNIERDGVAFGMAHNDAVGTAGAIALERCRGFEAKRAAARCQVVVTFSGECFAIAYDPEVGKPGAGWGVGADQLIANQKAIAMCEKAAGPARKGYCQVERFGCDTGPKLPAKTDAEAQKDAVPESLRPEAKPDTPADAKPAPPGGLDIKMAPHDDDKDKQQGSDAKTDAKTDKSPGPKSFTSAEAPPASKPGPEGLAKPSAAADRPEAKGRAVISSPLLPVVALAGVAIAYAAGQQVRGRLRGGLTERQIITGGALAVIAALAVKVLDLAGADTNLAAALAGLIALGAALLA